MHSNSMCAMYAWGTQSSSLCSLWMHAPVQSFFLLSSFNTAEQSALPWWSPVRHYEAVVVDVILVTEEIYFKLDRLIWTVTKFLHVYCPTWIAYRKEKVLSLLLLPQAWKPKENSSTGIKILEHPLSQGAYFIWWGHPSTIHVTFMQSWE